MNNVTQSSPIELSYPCLTIMLCTWDKHHVQPYDHSLVPILHKAYRPVHQFGSPNLENLIGLRVFWKPRSQITIYLVFQVYNYFWNPSTQDFEVDKQWFVATPKATITSTTDVYDECGTRRFTANLATSFPCHICLLDIATDPDALFQVEFDLVDDMDDSSGGDMPSISP